LMIPYGVYLAADAIHASGVVAVVTCGLMLSRRSAEFFSPTVRLQVYAVWDAVVFILNGVVFVLIGLQLRAIVAGLATMTMTQLLAAGALFSVLGHLPAARVGRSGSASLVFRAASLPASDRSASLLARAGGRRLERHARRGVARRGIRAAGSSE